MERILISACLLGETCRWHGRKTSMSSFVRKYLTMHPDTEFISVCPEMLGGLPCPRSPVKRQKGRVFETCEDKSLRKNVTGKDVTDSFISGANRTLEVAREHKCKNAIFCKWSPSCGETGITTRLLQVNGLSVIHTF